MMCVISHGPMISRYILCAHGKIVWQEDIIISYGICMIDHKRICFYVKGVGVVPFLLLYDILIVGDELGAIFKKRKKRK